jgi:hypothetical protein
MPRSRRRSRQGSSQVCGHYIRISETNSSLPADPLSLYKHKDDLVTLTSALNLKTEGTVIKLTALIKSHLSNNPSIELDPHFAGLFLQKQCHMDSSAE